MACALYLTILMVAAATASWPNFDDHNNSCAALCRPAYEKWMGNELCATCEEQCFTQRRILDRENTNCRAKCVELTADADAIKLLDSYIGCIGLQCEGFVSHEFTILSDRKSGLAVPIPRFDYNSLTSTEFIDSYLRKSIPIILTGVTADWAAFDMSLVTRAPGQIHSTEFAPESILNIARENHYPFSDAVDWKPSGFWGGMIGHGAGRHADMICDIFFAAQIVGAKHWRLHWLSPDINNGANIGENLKGDVIYEGLVSEGEILIFYPWLPHETTNYETKSQSLHGTITKKDIPHRALNRNPLQALMPTICTEPLVIDDSGDDQTYYLPTGASHHHEEL